MIVGTIVIVAITIVIGVVVDRRIGLVPRAGDPDEAPARRPAHTAGEAPATAIRAGGNQLAKLRASQRCSACRTVLAHGEDDHVRYGDRDLIVLHFQCPQCGAKRVLYVERVA